MQSADYIIIDKNCFYACKYKLRVPAKLIQLYQVIQMEIYIGIFHYQPAYFILNVINFWRPLQQIMMKYFCPADENLPWGRLLRNEIYRFRSGLRR